MYSIGLASEGRGKNPHPNGYPSLPLVHGATSTMVIMSVSPGSKCAPPPPCCPDPACPYDEVHNVTRLSGRSGPQIKQEQLPELSYPLSVDAEPVRWK